MNNTNYTALPRLWTDLSTELQHTDTAVEAAHLEIGRLQNTNTLLSLLLDEATSRISDLAQYQGKAATIIASLKGHGSYLKGSKFD